MRRLIAAAALALLALPVAACSSDDDGGSPSGGNSASAGAGAAAGNTKQVCADARQVISSSSAKFGEEMAKAAAASATGDTATQQKQVTALRDLVVTWAGGLAEQASKAEDQKLKDALTEMSSGFSAAAAKFKTAKDLESAAEYMDSPEIAAAGKKLDEICGA